MCDYNIFRIPGDPPLPLPPDELNTIQCSDCTCRETRACINHGYPISRIPQICEYKNYDARLGLESPPTDPETLYDKSPMNPKNANNKKRDIPEHYAGLEFLNDNFR